MQKHAVGMLVLFLVSALGWGSGLPVSGAQPRLDKDVVAKLSAARLATAKYAMDLARAKADK